MSVIQGQSVLDCIIVVFGWHSPVARRVIDTAVAQMFIDLGPLVTHLKSHVFQSSLVMSMNILSHESGKV